MQISSNDTTGLRLTITWMCILSCTLMHTLLLTWLQRYIENIRSTVLYSYGVFASARLALCRECHAMPHLSLIDSHSFISHHFSDQFTTTSNLLSRSPTHFPATTGVLFKPFNLDDFETNMTSS